MKIKFLYTAILLLATVLLFTNISSGPTVFGDCTLSPVSGSACDGCHEHAGRFSPITTISLKDSVGNIVANGLYKPLHNYTITVQVFALPSNEVPAITPLYGSQTVVLSQQPPYFPQAGVLSYPNTDSNALGTGVQLSWVNGRTYLEHNQRCTSGVFNVHWKAPAAGMGDVGIYASGLAVNNNAAFTGDDFDTTSLFLQEDLSIGITALEDWSLDYNIFPVPCIDGQFFIENLEGWGVVTIKNMLGQAVWEKRLWFNRNPQALQADLPKGVYTVLVAQEVGKGSRVLVFQ